MDERRREDVDRMPLPRQMLSVDRKERSFQYDDQLPNLPVPSLEETLEKYIQSVKLIVSKEEFTRSQQIVREFREGIGRQLHDKLLQKATKERNWMEKWWEEYAYLRIRDPHAPNGNFAAADPYPRQFWPPQEGTQVHRAALVSWFMLKFWEILKTETLKADRAANGTRFAMSQYLRLFNESKIPGEKIDQLQFYFKTEGEGCAPAHVLVICRGRYFAFDVLDGRGSIVTVPELESQLRRIRDICDRLPQDPWAVGALTAEHRTVWHRLRKHLINLHPDNLRHLEVIQSAIFVISLDDASPVTPTEVLKETLFGNATLRWFDKSMTCIIYRNGLIARNCDHAPFDGMINVQLILFIYLGLAECGYRWLGPTTVRDLAQPQELNFHLDEKITAAIAAADKRYQQTKDSIEVLNESFNGFGRTFIRKQKLHPDAFVQNALQYAYYRLHQKPAPTYQTATTRKFYNGRTETVRTCTEESVTWSRAMLDKSVSERQRLTLLLSAIDTHVRLMEEAKEGKGCDRHLLGLQILAMEDDLPMPEIFLDPSWTKSGGGGNFVLSTSFVGYTPITGCTTPMCRNGYGFFYSIEDQRINVNSVTFTADGETSAVKLFDLFCQSLTEMKRLIDRNSPIVNARL